MIITIDTNKWIIEINLQEKGINEKTIPNHNTPFQYNPINIKRKYYKKNDPQYKRRPLQKTIKKVLEISKFDRIVKQEPLLEFH